MKDLSKGKESSLILQFAIPMLIGNVFQQFYNIADSIIIGNYIGKEALAAVGASFPIIFTLVSLVIGFTMGSTIMIAQYFGAKDYRNVKRTIDTLNIVLFFVSIVLTFSGFLLSKPIFRLIQLPEEVIPQASLYLNIYMAGSIFFFGYNSTAAILRGLGDSKTPLYFLIISTIMNVGLALLFVVVFKLGIAGTAYATLISQAGAFITAVVYLNKTHKIVNFSFKGLEFDREIFKRSLKIGIPSGLQQTIVAVGMIALLWIVNLYGTDVVAAYSVAMRIDSFAALPAMNFAAALSTFVGQNLGAGKPERVKAGMIATLKMTTIISVVATFFSVLFAKPIMSVFTQDPNVVAIGAHYLVIVGLFYVTFSTMFVVNGVMRGAGDTFIPMIITFIALWVVRLPVSYLLAGKFGYIGIWWGTPTGWVVGLILSYIYYTRGKWKTKTVARRFSQVPDE